MWSYEQAAAVSTERHKGWSVEAGGDFAFSRSANAVPLTAVEFARACAEYPIVFTTGEESAPLVLLGLEERQNLFITDEGKWGAEYVPAFVRRYPFVFAIADGGQNFTVCIDEAFAGCNQEGRGEALFNPDGERTAYLEQVVAFLSEYQRQYLCTRTFTEKLSELGLLEPMQAQMQMPGGQRLSLTGFQVVSRERLKRLEAGPVKALLDDGSLELIHCHLWSLNRFAKMAERVAQRIP